MQRICDMYGVPAKRGGRVRYSGPFGDTREGTITGSTSTQMYLRIRLDGERLSLPFHPTWGLEYLSGSARGLQPADEVASLGVAEP
jgi:hypothetical protein